MRVIGLTGGIACGKTTACDTLRKAGIPVIDADAVSRGLTTPAGEALPAIRRIFGDSVFAEDGTLDRKALAALVFDDQQALDRLNGVMYPIISSKVDEALDALRTDGCKLCVLDVPLLFESGFDTKCDRIWCMTLPQEEQLRRVTERDHCTREQALARIRSQMATAEKAARSDVCISSAGSIAETAALVKAALERELAAASVLDTQGAE